jgi:hypothetical protein
MTTAEIELTMNLHQRIQPIGNNNIFAKKGNIPGSGRVYSYIPSLTFDSQQVRHRTKYTMPLATSCRLIKEQQVLNGPYRLSPLHHSPYKTVDSSLRQAKNNERGLLVACMWIATRPPLRHSARCLLGGCSLPILLARSIARFHPFPRYPSSLPSPPTPSVHVRHSLPSTAFPAIPHASRCRSTPPQQLSSVLFLHCSLARSIACSPPFPRYSSSLPRPPTPRSLACSLEPPPSPGGRS